MAHDMSTPPPHVELQVLICTLGQDGIERVAHGAHPRVPGVAYLVSWQIPDGEGRIPPELIRDDVKVVRAPSVGLSKNRNNALANSSAPYLLMGDDDVSYYRTGLESVIRAFREHPDCGLLTFRHDGSAGKKYPTHKMPLTYKFKGYYISAVEIAVRADYVRGRISFDERFGLGAEFPAGEDDVFFSDCLRSGIRGMFIPVTILSHPELSTGERLAGTTRLTRVKGAVFLRTGQSFWPLRMLTHAFRHMRAHGGIRSGFDYIRWWLQGVRDFKKM
ncbi:MAG: glycosyltransferase [Muribaculaceae bacterium]|nr:glycosyltransferase [Muribaculaceae bacterium]